MSRALDLILTGRSVDAREALAIGLVNRIVEHGKARETAEALACELAALPQAAMRADLGSVHENAFTGDRALALKREGANGYAAVFEEEVYKGRAFHR